MTKLFLTIFRPGLLPVTAILCLVLPSPAFAQATGRIRGTVTDSTGVPLRRVRVLAANRSNGSRTETPTDANGIYEFPSLEAGNYDLTFTKRGFDDGELNQVVVQADRTTTADITLEPGQSSYISGLVSDQAGAMVSGATITAIDLETNESFTTQTNQLGEYKLLLPFGTYDITAEMAGGAPLTQTGISVGVSQTSQVNFTLTFGSIDSLIPFGPYLAPSRPGIVKPAEFQHPSFLQVEFGYDGSFHSKEESVRNTTPLTVRYSPINRLLLEASLDTFTSRRAKGSSVHEKGVGDTRLWGQVLALRQRSARPSLAFAYGFKVPSANEQEGLGTGRIDHKAAVLAGQQFGRTNVQFNAAALFVGRKDSDGWTTGGLAAFRLSREIDPRFTVHSEWSWQTKDYEQPRGVFGLGAFTYYVSPRVALDAGVRVGLSPNSPRIGVLGGITFGIGRF